MPGPEDVTGPPILLDFLVALAEYMGFLAAVGLLWMWRATWGRLLLWLADALKFHAPSWTGGFTIDLGGPFRDVNNAVVSWLGAWATGSNILAGRFFHSGAALVRWTALEIQNTTNDVLRWGDWLLDVKLPKWAKWATYVAFPWVLVGKYVRNLIRYALLHMARVTKVIVHEGGVVAGRLPRALDKRLAKDENWLKWLSIAVGGVLGGLYLPHPHKIPSIGGVWRGLTKRLARIERRLHRLEGLLGAAGMAAVMANALGLPNWRCITRGNLGRTSRALCGLPTKFLNDLLGILADIWILENVCVLISPLEAAASDIGGPLVSALTDVGAGLCKGSIGAADPLQGATPKPPPVVYSTPATVGV